MRLFQLVAIIIVLTLGCAPEVRRVPTEAPAPPPVATSSSLPGVRFVPQIGHAGAVRSIAISGNGKTAATCAADGTIKIWDLPSERLVRTIGRSAWEIESVALSPDGTRAVSGGVNDAELLREIVEREGRGAIAVQAENHFPISIWDLTTGKVVKSIPGHGERIVAVVYSSDGKKIVSASLDRTLRTWDADTGKAISVTPLPAAPKSISASPDLRTVLVLGDDGVVRVVVDGAITRNIDMPSAVATAFSADGSHHAVSDAEGLVRVYDKAGGSVRIAAGKGTAPGLAFLGNNEILTSGGTGPTTSWNIASGKIARSFDDGNATARLVTIAANAQNVLVGSDAGALRLSDSATGRLRRAFNPQNEAVTSLSLADNGTLAVGRSHGVALWDLGSVQRASVVDPAEPTSSIAISRDGTEILTSGAAGVNVWRASTYERIRNLAPRAEGAVAFSRDGKLVAGPLDRSLAVWNSSGTLVARLEGAPPHVSCVTFSADGRRVAAGGAGSVAVWETGGKRVGSWIIDKGVVRTLAFSAIDSVSVVSQERLSALYVVNLATSRVRLVAHLNANATAAHFASEGPYLFVGAADGSVSVWEASSGATVTTLDGHVRPIRALAYMPSRRLVIAGAEDGSVKVFSLDRMAPMTLLVSGDDWLAYSTDGYFDSSRAGAELVAMVSDKNVFSVDQFAFLNNRPDLMIRRLGIGSAPIAEYFERRYKNRLEKAGFTETQLTDLNVPDAALVEVRQSGKAATVRARFTDSRYALASWSVFVNGVQIDRPRALTGRDATVDATIELSAGTNTIEVSARDARGVESARPQRTLEVADVARGELYFVGFGVSAYHVEKMRLRFAAKDAHDLSRTFGRLEKSYAAVHAKEWTDDKVSRAAIGEAKAFLANAKVDDTVVAFFAGHGIHTTDADAKFYYIAPNTEPTNKSVKATAIPFDSIEDLFADITPRRKLLLLDACESGENRDEGPPSAARAAPRSRSRGLVLDTPESRPTEIRRVVSSQRDRFVFSDITRRSGTVVFASSQGGESSWEGGDDENHVAIENGQFTRALLDGLGQGAADLDGNGVVTKRELRDYVVARVARLSGDAQHPTIDRDNSLQAVELRLKGL